MKTNTTLARSTGETARLLRRCGTNLSFRPRAGRRRGFSVIEMLIALTISGVLLSACLVALDSSFKSYEVTTDAASTHVVSRMIMHRMLAMIRTGEEFGPYPIQVLSPTRMESTYIEFVSLDDAASGKRQITRLERGADTEATDGSYRLLFKRWDYEDGVQQSYVEYPLLRGVAECKFTLEYDIGPTLRRATIDITIKPNDAKQMSVSTDLEAPILRLIASTGPRRLD